MRRQKRYKKKVDRMTSIPEEVNLAVTTKLFQTFAGDIEGMWCTLVNPKDGQSDVRYIESCRENDKFFMAVGDNGESVFYELLRLNDVYICLEMEWMGEIPGRLAAHVAALAV